MITSVASLTFLLVLWYGSMDTVITASAAETKKIGFIFAKNLKKRQTKQKQALVVALEGNLGSGKTTFIQGFAVGLGVRENILSPTFLILKKFTIASKNYKNFYHIDTYRLKNPGELLELGFYDLIRNPENLIIIEWAEKIRRLLPKKTLRIKCSNLKGNSRKIQIFNF